MGTGAAESNRLEAQERIRRKLAVLQDYVANGIPTGSFVPKSINQFRQWEDDARGLQRIGSPNTMSAESSPHNKHLIETVKRLLAELSEKDQARQGRSSEKGGGSKSRRKELDVLKKKVAHFEDLVTKLVGDWHMAQNELNDLKDQLRNRERRNQDLNAEVSRLRSLLATRDRKGLRSI